MVQHTMGFTDIAKEKGFRALFSKPIYCVFFIKIKNTFKRKIMLGYF